MELILEPAFWASVILLVGMEVALSADNVVFISTMAARLPEEHRRRVLRIGMVLAAVFRLVLLGGVVWLLGLERTAFSVAGWSPSWRELILIAGGMFLIYKAVTELHHLVEPPAKPNDPPVFDVAESSTLAIAQIVLINAVFSVDSILTAIGLTPYVAAMAIAVIASVAILYFASEAVGKLIARHPAIKALALGFLLLVGVVLVADGLGLEVLRPYLYGAMAFAILVLAGSKIVRHFAGERAPAPLTSPLAEPVRSEPRFETKPAEAMAVAPMVEPTLTREPEVGIRPEPEPEPEPEVVSISADPDLPPSEPDTLEAAAPDYSEDTVVSGPADIAAPHSEQPTIIEPGAPAAEMADSEDAVSEQEALGEDESRVQRSRPKRALTPRRPVRRRTGKRRE